MRGKIILQIIFLCLFTLSCAHDRRTYDRLSIFFDSLPPFEEWSTGQKPATSVKKPITAKKEGDVIYPHPPWAEDKCELCHANNFSMAAKVKEPQLCFNCHSDKKKLVESFYGTGAVKDENGSELVVHMALAFPQSCTFRCHVSPPHFSKFPKLLQGKVENVCVSCHEAPSEPIDMRGQNCMQCHNPHASPNKKLLKF